MKIVLTENQYKSIILEETNGIDSFIDELLIAYPRLESYIDLVKKFIEDSNCQDIELGTFRFPASGISLHNKVVINKRILKNTLENTLFVIFHEVAHQYQYKKYGSSMMHRFYVGEVDMDEAVRFLKYTENVADQFGLRKCREFVKLGLLTKEYVPKMGGYDNYSDMMFVNYLNMLRNKIEESGETDDEKISECLYNWAIVKL
jgi:hypothetical protein